MTSYKVEIVVPRYFSDWLVWRVYARGVLVGSYRSMWQAEQCAKGILSEYPSYQMEVISDE